MCLQVEVHKQYVPFVLAEIFPQIFAYTVQDKENNASGLTFVFPTAQCDYVTFFVFILQFFLKHVRVHVWYTMQAIFNLLSANIVRVQ